LRVVPVACLSDNYAYLVVGKSGGEVAIVDPSEPAPVIAVLERENIKPTAIWNTHHHFDHTGGNEALAARYGIEWVSGHVSDKGRIAGQTRFLEAGERFGLGELGVEILHIPGHTLGAIAYVVRGSGQTAVFTGDTMFHAGCGRLFEGTPADMHASLQSLLAVGNEARVYPGHEYTVNNLRFAESVEPSHAPTRVALEEAKKRRDRGEPTVGTTIAHERAVNPFVRTRSAEIRRSLGVGEEADDVTALAAIRKAKDGFK
jgi:hydroxyacylglutathione hydrolase